MYGSSVQYGWNNNNAVSNSNVVELPLAPVRRPAPAAVAMCCHCLSWHTFGLLLGLLSAATLALGVADVVVTYQDYIVGWDCNTGGPDPICDPNNLIWTWIGIGIWTSLPVFIFAIYAIRKGSNPSVVNPWFEVKAFVCGIIFTPAMVVVSALEVFMGAGIYYWDFDTPLTSDDLAKALIPLTIAVLGFFEFILCFCALFDMCCYGRQMAVAPMPVMRPAPAPMPASSCHTCPQSSAVGIYNNRMSSGPNFPGSFYAPAGPSRTYNYFSGMTPPGPNPSYNYFRG